MTKSHRWWQWWWWKIKVFPLASNRVDREGKHKGREKREGGGQQDDIFDQRDHWDDIFYQSDDPGGIKWYLTRAAADKTTVHWMSHFYFDTKTLSVWTMPTKYALGQIGPVCCDWTILWPLQWSVFPLKLWHLDFFWFLSIHLGCQSVGDVFSYCIHGACFILVRFVKVLTGHVSALSNQVPLGNKRICHKKIHFKVTFPFDISSNVEIKIHS